MQDIWNWLTNINWIIALLAAIPLSVVGNLITPKIQDFLARRPHIRRAAQLEELRSDFKLMEEYKNDPPTFYNATFTSLFRVLVMIALGGVLNSSLLIVGFPFYLVAVMEAWKHLRILANLRDFEQYRQEISDTINALEAQTKPMK